MYRLTDWTRWRRTFLVPLGGTLLFLGLAATSFAVHADDVFELDVAGADAELCFEGQGQNVVAVACGDANVADETKATPYGGDDWATIHSGGGSAFASVFVDDGYRTTDVTRYENSFFTGGGSKDVYGIQDGRWQYDTTNDQVPDGDDIVTAFAAAYEVPDQDGSGTDTVFYFGADRFDWDGDKQIGFWFFRQPVGLGPVGEAGTGQGYFTEEHTDGDILVLADFRQGGRAGQVTVYKWQGDDATGSLVQLSDLAQADCSVVGLDDSYCAVVNNSVGEDPPWDYFNKDNTSSYDGAGALFEGGINVSDVLFPNGGEIGCFSSFLAETRSSHAENAQLKDFALGNFPVCGISVEKTGEDLSKIGDPVNYEITVSNTGKATLYKYSIIDNLLGDLTDDTPAGDPYTSDCGVSLAPNTSCTITYTREVVEGDTDPLVNTVTIDYREYANFSGQSFGGSAIHTTNLFQPEVEVTKTGPANAFVGEEITYDFTITNTGSWDSPDLLFDVAADGKPVEDDVLGDLTAEATTAGCDRLSPVSEDGQTPAESCTFSKSYTVTSAVDVTNTVDVEYNPEGFPNDITDSDSHTVANWAPSISKTAAGTYQNRYDWTIDKTVEPESQSGFAGDTLEWTWSITWQSVFDQEINHSVTGVITVSNPAPIPMTVALADTLDDGSAVTISADADCDFAAGMLDVPANSSATCPYSAAPGDRSATLNTATATLNGIDYPATASVSWTAGPNVGLDATISDSNNVSIPVDATQPYTYTDEHECSTDSGDYEGGTYTGDADNTATITWTGGSDNDDATTTYNCYLWDVSKTADGTYQDRYGWTIEKTVEPESQSGFAGDTLEWTWSITWSSYFIEEINHDVTGVITVTNPNLEDALTVDVTDALTGPTAATVVCNDDDGGTSLTIPAGGSGTCNYSAGDVGTQLANNTGTATRNGVSVSDTVPVSWTAGPNVGLDATISDSNNVSIPVDATQPYTYTDEHECSTDSGDYEGGTYTGDADNTATITWTGGSDNDDATTTYNCYLWDVSKTADGTYQDRYGWTIDKTVEPESQSGFAGDTLEWTWSITWSSYFIEEINHDVTGVITVTNPNLEDALTVDVTDALTGPTAATVVCNDDDGGTSLTIPAGGSGTCNYSAGDVGTQLANNTGTATRNGVSVSDTVPVSWTAGPNVGLDATISDSNNVSIPVDATQPYTYTDEHECSTDSGDYEGGTYTGDADNTATITWTGGSDNDDATTTYNCYIPSVTKDATATFDRTHTWSIEKSVDPTSQSGYAGDFLDWKWTVNVSETSADSNFAISGKIYVQNPNPDSAMTVVVSDVLNDGTAVTVDCGSGSTSLTVLAGTTGECSYSAIPDDASATLNTATATLNAVGYNGTSPVSFVPNIIGGTATVTDDQIGLDEDLTAGDGPWEYEATDDHTCSATAGDYGADGTYSATLDNTATVTDSEGNSSDADASTTYTCGAGFMDLKKLTNGAVNDTKDWTFKVFEGPDGFDGTQVGSTSSTLGDDDGVLTFGTPVLRPDETYTVCEITVPAGWTSQWQVDVDGDGVFDATVIPYNPNADDNVPSDLGNRCVDFGDGTTIPATVGVTLRFQVDNNFPGGNPRTPGYWKNWNRCSTGGQAANADRQGGWEEGYWLLEDVLDPAIGGGIIWDDILTDGKLVPITTCEQAVEILDQRVVTANGKVGDGKKLASDGARTLAMHLLAAQLNFGAGACTDTGDVWDAAGSQDIFWVALEAEKLLDKIDFDGTKTTAYLTSKNKTDYPYALKLAKVLDQYNNGLYCGDFGG